MATKSTKSKQSQEEQRTIEVIERELEAAQQESGALNAEYRSIPDRIDAAADDEKHGDVPGLRQRMAELPSRMFTAHKKVLRLRVELAEERFEEFSEEIRQHSEAARYHREKMNEHRQSAEREGGLADSMRQQGPTKRNAPKKLQRELDALEEGGLSLFEKRLHGGGKSGEGQRPSWEPMIKGLNG